MPKYIDLTLTLKPGMRGVEKSVAKTINKDGWNASTFHLYSHSGTHMDAPLHFNVSSAQNTIEAIPVDRFFVDAWLIDLLGIEDKALIEIDDLGKVKNLVKKGEGLLFKTGWSKHVNSAKYRDNLPRLSANLVKWCIDKGISLIGVEPPSVADVNNKVELTNIHELLLGADILIVEGLTNLDKITKPKVQLVALPIKFDNADGAPARVVAIEK